VSESVVGAVGGGFVAGGTKTLDGTPEEVSATTAGMSLISGVPDPGSRKAPISSGYLEDTPFPIFITLFIFF